MEERYPPRHKISDHIVSQVKLHFLSDNWHGALLVFENWAVLLMAALLSIWCNRHCSTFVAAPTYVLCAFVIGARQRAFADLLHQAGHLSLAKNPRLNFVLGTYFSGFWVLQSLSGYMYSHRSHHQFLGHIDFDPDYRDMVDRNLYGENCTDENIRKFLLWRIWGPVEWFRYLKLLVTQRIACAEESRSERFQRMIFWAGIFAIVIATKSYAFFLGYWVVPYLTASSYIGSFIEILEHYPLMERRAGKTSMYFTRNRICGPVWNFFFGIHNEGYHLIHHVFPAVPRWNFKKVHKILLQDEIYAKLHINVGWQNLLLSLLPSQNKITETQTYEISA